MPVGNQDKLKKSFIIDNDCKYLLDNYSWFLDGKGYPTGDKTINGKKNRIKLHHLIIGKPNKGMCIDHKNGNKLDNRKENLHIVTYSYNNFNRPKPKNSKQEYKGIQELPSGRFRARSNDCQIGIFNTAKEAYNAYLEYSQIKFKGELYYAN